MLARPMIMVHDVEKASLWFQNVLKLESGHGGPDYEMLMFEDTMVAQIHRWEAHEHPHQGDPSDPSRGNGVLLWFSTPDFEGLVSRLSAHGVTILEGPHYNPNAFHEEVWIVGPEGYKIVVSGPYSPKT